MKTVTVLTKYPCIQCPVNQELRPLIKCQNCDAFAGFEEVEGKKSVKCKADEF